MVLPDKDLWQSFEEFLWNFQLGYFTDCQICLPWGRWNIITGNNDSLIWRGNADMAAASMAIAMQELGAKLAVTHYGVYLSPSWQGDVKRFADELQNLGWHNSFNSYWLVKELADQPLLVQLPPGYKGEVIPLCDAAQIPELLAVYNTIENNSSAATGIFTPPQFSLNIERFLAVIRLAATGEVVGYGLLAHNDRFAYLYALGVVPEHRNRGLAKALVALRWQTAMAAGVQYAVTAVVTENAASLKVQQGQGYRIFATTNAWQPAGHGSGAYAIAEELR